MIHLLITIYAIYLYNNLYPNKMSIISFILICLFPAFFISATAAINLEYLNPLYDRYIDEYDYSNFLEDIMSLDNINAKFFVIFLPIYLSISYLLYYKKIMTFINKKKSISFKDVTIKDIIKKIIMSKKKHLKKNKLIIVILGIILRFRGIFFKNIFKTSLTSGSLSRSL